MHEINILMTCTWTFRTPHDGTTIDDVYQVHSTYKNHTDALAAAEFYKRDDEVSGLCNSRYWVIVTTIEDKAPVEEEA